MNDYYKHPIMLTLDANAKSFLASENQLQNMRPRPPLNHICIIWQNEHAYCMATHDYGHPDPIDNGFLVMILPKHCVTGEQADKVFQEARKIARVPGGPPAQSFIISNDPGSN